VQRLRRAGAVIVGTTNMTEFAYSGLGLNPHYGTPRNPWQREIDGAAFPADRLRARPSR
jgi:aspartyl-tRNA(Asn)/glutamyl-tRNA(Gln) amidotransferase subunit A